MEAFAGQLNGIIWSDALICLCLGAGLYFSIRTRFLQVRHFGHCDGWAGGRFLDVDGCLFGSLYRVY